MEDFIYYNELYLIYKDLLSDKIQEVFDLYYGENLTMQEIADIKGISKSRVGIIIKNTSKKLNEYENILHIYNNRRKLNELLNENDIRKMKKEIELVVKGE